VYGNTYYVGPHGLGAILVTSPQGHVLIDGALPESVPGIVENIHTLGFRIEDVKLIVSSHVHFDHAGGIAALQHASGAAIAASPSSAAVLRAGAMGRDDPQYGTIPSISPVPSARVIADGETLRVGSLALTAHFTPGHTSGGTTWSWVSCERDRCMNMVYADSQTPVSADDFLFTSNATYPGVLADFARSETVLDALPCDILMTPHPGASGFWERVAERDRGNADALVDREACKRLAASSRRQLDQRVAKERSAP
jgi:metallo-beta-lactamase class B